MLGSMNLPSKFKQVIQDISGSAGLDLVDPSIFSNASDLKSVNKSQIPMEARCFTETPLDSRKCVVVITRILYLLTQGEEFTSSEKTDIFFSSTRLFQSSSVHLRRMVHLLIKTLQPSQEEAFVVTSTLTKDIASQNDAFRANALRTIVRIVDPSTAMQLERFIKSAIVDKNPFVASTALLCGVHLARSVPEFVRRWVNEVSECVSSKHPMVQFHALALLYELKRNDRLALHRIIATLTAKITKSPIAECLLIRYATKLLAQPGDSPLDVSLLEFLEASLSHRSEIVSFEAAKAYINLTLHCAKFSKLDSPAFDVTTSITALQILLTNLKPVIRFAAIRVLYQVAQIRPDLVVRCNVDIEPLVGDSCRAVAVLALITLLKTGADQQPDKLLKQISGVMIDISETHRIEIVTALKQLCVNHPVKAKPIVNFLATQLRDEGGVLSKTHTVEVLCQLTRDLPNIHELILLHLCDFIEDCEFLPLCCHILAFLAVEVPKTEHPAKFLRFIYNRCILETATVRGAAIDCLARIARLAPEVRPDVVTVLNSGLLVDIEDEVRDRSRLALKLLTEDNVIGQDDSASTTVPPDASDGDDMDDLLQEVIQENAELAFSTDALVDQLAMNFARGNASAAIDFSSLPTEAAYKAMKARENEGLESAKMQAAPAMTTNDLPSTTEAPEIPVYQEQVKALAPDGVSLGDIHHVCSPVLLTETEAEYVIQVVKHFWENTDYVSLEVFVRNTLEHQALKNIDIRLGVPEQGAFEVVKQTQIPTLKFDEELPIYVLLRRQQNVLQPSNQCSIISQLSYTVVEDEDEAFAYDDIYEMEPIVLSIGDFVSPYRMPLSECGRYWTTVGAEKEEVVRMQFGQIKNGVAGAAEKLCATLNMHKNEVKSEQAGPEKLFFSGRMVGNHNVILIQASLVESPNYGVLGKIQVRCADQTLSRSIADCLRGV